MSVPVYPTITPSRLSNYPIETMRTIDDTSALELNGYHIVTIGDLIRLYFHFNDRERFYDYICDFLEVHGRSLNRNMIDEVEGIIKHDNIKIVKPPKVTASIIVKSEIDNLRYVNGTCARILKRYNIKTIGDLLRIYIKLNDREKFYDYICNFLEHSGSSLNRKAIDEVEGIVKFVFPEEINHQR